jgi:hypothetical protein
MMEGLKSKLRSNIAPSFRNFFCRREVKHERAYSDNAARENRKRGKTVPLRLREE